MVRFRCRGPSHRSVSDFLRVLLSSSPVAQRSSNAKKPRLGQKYKQNQVEDPPSTWVFPKRCSGSSSALAVLSSASTTSFLLAFVLVIMRWRRTLSESSWDLRCSSRGLGTSVGADLVLEAMGANRVGGGSVSQRCGTFQSRSSFARRPAGQLLLFHLLPMFEVGSQSGDQPVGNSGTNNEPWHSSL